ncbi:Peptidyl-prolyl cis-trans isomerase cyp15 [Friedmanniomyces endolithicus]|nr:Peptidyl-prolyl cis-trans isomerase cyp15 [Friedmanniomyces endolithicus]
MATEVQLPQGTKRAHDETEADEGDTKQIPDDASASDDDIGPALPSAEARKKKRRKLPYEKQYVAALPAADRYSKSLMHRDQLSFCTFTQHTDFLITSSVDGYVKFWKKVAGGIEFVKEYKAHDGEIKGVTGSVDGRSYATVGVDNTIKIFDVVNFDLLAVLQLESTPKAVCYVHGHGSSYPVLAVSSETSGDIAIYDGRGENQQPIQTIAALHRKPVHLMAYNDAYDCVVSVDESGMIEYWRPSGGYDKPDNVFDMKSSTSLFEFKKAKSVPSSLTISPTYRQFATFSFPDRKVRVFDFASGKLDRTYDESITIQMAASDNPLLAESEARDAMLVTTGASKSRFYMFTNTTQISKSDRDIHNEKPKTLNLHPKASAEAASRNSRMATTATLHTTLGDIHLRLYPQHAPKAVENFTIHVREGYYNNLIFHRVIRKFMIQTGDPLGDGTGGESIWGKEFEDEFTPELRHDRPYVLSMANAGPKTNASQFFITTGEAAWLDGKHTIFGRCVRGMEVVHAIENVRVWKEKPVEDVKIVDVSVE